ncbi:MAG TPA: SDR family oxidoreductase [Myxococcota bacterium]|nr:SDR family oxidoreductase [Myxococcota bacterium]HOH76440.1 SDR family oxidoreductase [Myxococcota bacterium]
MPEIKLESDQPRATALVTGATVRVGLEIALALARSGRDMVLHCRRHDQRAEDAAAAVAATGARAFIVEADLTDQQAVERMFRDIGQMAGGLDILVNSAAVFGFSPPDNLSVADFDHFIDTNLKAPYMCCILARKLMKPGASIVNIADVAAERPFRNHVPYCISKAGIVMLTRSLAKAWAPDIRVNAISPGTVLFRDDEDEATRAAVRRRIPMARIGTPEDVAKAVIFLCDNAAHTTGAILQVDGGRSLD